MQALKIIFFHCFLGYVYFSQAQSVQTYFPSTNVAWKNIKTDYGAVGDGNTDDTKAFQKALKTQLNPFNSVVAIYIPNGTYLVSDSIRALMGYYDCCLTLQGQDPEKTIIKLKDKAPGFQDPNNPRPIFQTRAGNQAFGNYVFNLSINTGLDNKGAIGIDYITSNYGAMYNVNITSPDGSAYCGVMMERQWPGPGLLKNIRIDGFKYGIRMGTCEYSMTFENITLKNQSIAGILNKCNTIAIRNLNSSNKVPAVVNTDARLVILDSKLNEGNSSNHGIVVSGKSLVFARNICSTGYKGALSVEGQTIQGAKVSEYHNQPDYSLFSNPGKSLGLRIEETPEYINNNPADWANVADFGAKPTNPQYGFFDATDEIQAAFNSGKKAIYFGEIGDNNTAYCIYKDIVIPPSVEIITGFNLGKLNFFNGSKFIVNNTGSSPLFIERTKGIHLHNNSKRTLVMRFLESCLYSNTINNTNGKVYLEDWVNPFEPKFPVQMWARHFNTEIQPEDQRNIDNPGGRYWILGLKTEGRANIIRTSAGGATEVLGGLIYPASAFSGKTQAAFTVQDACLSIVGLTMTTYVNNGWYGVAVEEIQNGIAKSLPSEKIWADSPYNFSFFSSSRGNCGVSTSVTKEKPIASPISVFPNPTSDFFTIKNDELDWDIAVLKNTLGQQVRTFVFPEKPSLAGLQSGAYFLTVFTKKALQQQTLKVIKP